MTSYAEIARKYIRIYIDSSNPSGGREEAEADLAKVAVNPDEEFLTLLTECRDALRGGLETPGMLEPEWSMADRLLVNRLTAVIEGLDARAKAMAG